MADKKEDGAKKEKASAPKKSGKMSSGKRKLQRLTRHLKKHPQDSQSAAELPRVKSGGVKKRKAPYEEKWTRETKVLAQMAVKSGFKGSAVNREWARGDIHGGKKPAAKLQDAFHAARVMAHEKAKKQAEEDAKKLTEKPKQERKQKPKHEHHAKGDGKGKPGIKPTKPAKPKQDHKHNNQVAKVKTKAS